jgi:DASS family divalent anion:Na+ symporter
MISDIWFFPYQCTYYIQIESEIIKEPLFNMKKFFIYNAFSNILRIAAVFVSIPYWKWLGLL